MRRAQLPILQVTRPCREPWSEMVGDARIRHCGRCDKDVHDLTTMTAAEIAALVGRGAPWCARFYRRADGTVVTADCTDRPPARAAAAALGVGLALATAACGAHRPAPTHPDAVGPAASARATLDDDEYIVGDIGPDPMFLGIVTSPPAEPMLQPPAIDASDPPEP